MSWTERASCHPDNRGDLTRAEWTALWYPNSGATSRLAREICSSCPVADRCDLAGRHEKEGMWAGMSRDDRRALNRGRLPPMAVHGYRGGVNAHRRRGEEPCDECRKAQSRADLERRARMRRAA